MRNRSSSIGTDFHDCQDMCVLRACWDVILSFMEDESEIKEKVGLIKLEKYVPHCNVHK